MATARAIGRYPSWQVLTEAELLNAKRVAGKRRVTLEEAVEEALRRNLDLSVARAQVRSGRALVKAARAPLLPNITVSTTARLIDEPTADASLGSQPQFLWTGAANLEQVLYAEPAWSGYFIQEYLQEARKHDLETQVLNVVRDVTTAYLNVLRAKTAERIQKKNLEVTRQNLELARTRVDVG